MAIVTQPRKILETIIVVTTINMMNSQNSTIFSTTKSTDARDFMATQNTSVGVSSVLPVSVFFTNKGAISPASLAGF